MLDHGCHAIRPRAGTYTIAATPPGASRLFGQILYQWIVNRPPGIGGEKMRLIAARLVMIVA
jgi:hypothetical protein